MFTSIDNQIISQIHDPVPFCKGDGHQEPLIYQELFYVRHVSISVESEAFVSRS